MIFVGHPDFQKDVGKISPEFPASEIRNCRYICMTWTVKEPPSPFQMRKSLSVERYMPCARSEDTIEFHCNAISS